MNITYEQLSPREALQTYCDWLLAQMPKFREPPYEWYFLFYPIRTLLLGARLLQRDDYAQAVWPHLDNYIGEQLPNGALSSNFRGKPAAELTQREIEHLLRTGKFNLADNGSNVHALIQGAQYTADTARRERYLAAAGKWLDDWVPIWGLADGSYGNGIWGGHKLNGTYSMAMNVCSALAAFTLATGNRHYIENAENFALFQCANWHEAGIPIRFNVYPLPEHKALIGDYGRIFYMLEALCWTHFVSNKDDVRTTIAGRIRQWLHADILQRFPLERSWFDLNKLYLRQVVKAPMDGWEDSADDGLRFYWQVAKCCAIPHLLAYFCNHIEEQEDIRLRVQKAGHYLSHPLKARMCAVMADDVEPEFCMQATGFAGLSVAEALAGDSPFQAYVQ
jgi:hypothetical protein